MVEISLLLCTEIDPFHQENDLVEWTDDLSTVFRQYPDRTVEISGGLSIVVGQKIEILGRGHWFDEIRHLNLGLGRNEFDQAATVVNTAERSEDPSLVDITVDRRGLESRSYTSNRIAYEQEMQLARARAERLRKELGDDEGERWLSSWMHGLPEAANYRVPLALRTYTYETDLALLLEQPRPVL